MPVWSMKSRRVFLPLSMYCGQLDHTSFLSVAEMSVLLHVSGVCTAGSMPQAESRPGRPRPAAPSIAPRTKVRRPIGGSASPLRAPGRGPSVRAIRNLRVGSIQGPPDPYTADPVGQANPWLELPQTTESIESLPVGL